MITSLAFTSKYDPQRLPTIKIKKGIMGDYIRTTRECSFEDLSPSIVIAIRAHIEKYELGEIESTVLSCCETTSTKQKRGIFGGKGETVITGVMLTPQWLIWATSSNKESPVVLSARLREIQVQDYEKSEMHKLIQDTGLNVFGIRTDAVELGSTFIGFGVEPAAQKFRNLLRETLAEV